MDQDNNRKPDAIASVRQNIEEDIRQLAHQLYERCGREDNISFDDWLRAEEEFKR